LFVAEQVFAELTDAELRSVVTHEAGHLIAFDNLKRSLFRFASDLLPIVLYERALEHAWSQAVEASADEHAIRHDRQAALDLAEALVKLARLASPQACRAIPSAAFFTGDPSSGLHHRVRRLLQWTDYGAPRDPSLLPGLRLLAFAACASCLGAMLHVATLPHLLAPLHATLELLVKALR
jgi:Zn-dependent protease with chaperone function